MVDVNDSRLWAQGSRCYEQLKVVDDMDNLGCCELKPQDAINNSWLRMILMNLGHEPMALIAINSSKLWMTWMTLGRELKAPDVMNNSRLCMTRITLGRGLLALDAMNILDLLMTWMTQGHLLRALNAISRSSLWWTWTTLAWAQGSRCYEKLKVMDYMNDFELWA